VNKDVKSIIRSFQISQLKTGSKIIEIWKDLETEEIIEIFTNCLIFFMNCPSYFCPIYEAWGRRVRCRKVRNEMLKEKPKLLFLLNYKTSTIQF